MPTSILNQIRLGRSAALLQNIESGSMDGGATGDIVYIPYLVGLLLLGLILAMVGYWRVGASYSTQLGSQVGSVAPSVGNPAINALWQGWTNGNGPTNAFTVNTQDRSVSAVINTTKHFDLSMFGPMDFTITAGSKMHTRSERFYPGQPVCDSGNCNE